jgi:cation diffusion facilitator family transporter
VRVRDRYELPPEREQLNRKAVRLEWWTLAWMTSIIVVIYVTMGNSQAMKAAWIEDLLSFVPPVAFLIASRFRNREPTERFPYGYHRSISIAFLCAATALLTMGGYALFDSAMKLVRREHPTIGSVEIFGLSVWLGWVMIAALLYSGIPPVILGRMKLRVAAELHDKALHADADMNKADWLTAVAGIVGVVGIGVGWWWADPVAALFISVEIVRDGVKNMRRVVEDLMDSRPTAVDGKVEAAPDRLRRRIRELEWVEDADVRIREEGHVFTGEVYVIPKSGTADLPEELERIPELAREVDWRMYDLVVMPVTTLQERPGD